MPPPDHPRLLANLLYVRVHPPEDVADNLSAVARFGRRGSLYVVRARSGRLGEVEVHIRRRHLAAVDRGILFGHQRQVRPVEEVLDIKRRRVVLGQCLQVAGLDTGYIIAPGQPNADLVGGGERGGGEVGVRGAE